MGGKIDKAKWTVTSIRVRKGSALERLLASRPGSIGERIHALADAYERHRDGDGNEIDPSPEVRDLLKAIRHDD